MGPKSLKDGPGKMESAERPPGRRRRLVLDGELDGGLEKRRKPRLVKRHHICSDDRVSCDWAGLKLTM